MEDHTAEWGMENYSPSLIEEEEGKEEVKQSRMGWIVEKGLSLGKKVVITSIVVSSAPVVLPPFAVLSTIGLAFSFPFGFIFASYVCTEKLMSKLLPLRPPPSPLMLEYEIDEEKGGFETVEMDEDMKKSLESRIERLADGSMEYGSNIDLVPAGDGVDKELQRDFVGGEISWAPSNEEDVVENPPADISVENESDRYVESRKEMEYVSEDRREKVGKVISEIKVMEKEKGGTFVGNEADITVESRKEMRDIGEDRGEILDKVVSEVKEMQKEKQGTLVDNEADVIVESRREMHFVPEDRNEKLENVVAEVKEMEKEKGGTLVDNEADKNAKSRTGMQYLPEDKEERDTIVSKVKEIEKEKGGQTSSNEKRSAMETSKRGKKKKLKMQKASGKLTVSGRDEERVGKIPLEKDQVVQRAETVAEAQAPSVDVSFERKSAGDVKATFQEGGDSDTQKTTLDSREGQDVSVNGKHDAETVDSSLLKQRPTSDEAIDHGEGIGYSVSSVIPGAGQNVDQSASIVSDDFGGKPGLSGGTGTLELEGSSDIHGGSSASDEGLFTYESIWEQIDAIRTIVGCKAPRHSSFLEELKALYLFTGVEMSPPLEELSNLEDVYYKLRFLMSVIGVK